MMHDGFFSERLAKLRIAKNVSAREMSLAIGQNQNYINHIENQKAFPTMQIFFYICEYLQITPKDFFDESAGNPVELNSLFEDIKRLDSNAVAGLSTIVKEMLRKD